jgi:hypothetical protein
MADNHDDDVTPARRLSSLLRMKMWGMAASWLGDQPGIRQVVIDMGPKGLRVVVRDPLAENKGDRERMEEVRDGEDPSRAVMRAVSAVGND